MHRFKRTKWKRCLDVSWQKLTERDYRLSQDQVPSIFDGRDWMPKKDHCKEREWECPFSNALVHMSTPVDGTQSMHPIRPLEALTSDDG